METEEPPPERLDHRVIVDFIDPKARVLDLGCGDGSLLAMLINGKNCQGTGIEIDEKEIFQCIAKGLTVSQGDINTSLSAYSDKRFDYVILNESLQQVLEPMKTIIAALRVGKKVVVGIPNFCHWSARAQMFFRGRVPVTKELPYQWYNTPNLRFFSLKDFQDSCKDNQIKILASRFIDYKHEITYLPNLFARIGIYVLQK